MEYAAYLLVGVLLLAGGVCLRHRRRRYLAAHTELAEPDPPYDPASDGFYCMLLSDGTCRRGYLTKDGRHIIGEAVDLIEGSEKPPA